MITADFLKLLLFVSLVLFGQNITVFLVKERQKFLKKIKQKNPYTHVLGDQLLSLKNKKSTIAGLLKTSRILASNSN